MAFAMIHELARSSKHSVAMSVVNKEHPADFSRTTYPSHFGIPRISQVCFFEQRFLTGDLEFDFRESLAKRALAPTNENSFEL